MATRRFLRTRFDLLEIVELGDTKLFEAAVLPALVFTQKRGEDGETSGDRAPNFVRIYEAAGEINGHAEQMASLVDSLRRPRCGLVRVNGCHYRIATGHLPLIEAAVRTASAPAADEWRRRLAELEEYQALIAARLRGDQELFKIADVDAPRLTRGDGTDETGHDRDAPDRSSSPDDDR